MSNGEVPRDDNNAPALGLWDPVGHQIVPAQAVSIVTDSTGQKYGTINVNASFSASSMAINDPNTTSQKASVSAGGSLQVAGQGTAGTPGGGVVSIQGVAGGTAVPVSGSISATNPSVGTDGSAIPASSTLVGASDGANLQQLLVESASNRNLRIALYNGATEAAVTANGLAVQQATGSNLHAVLDSGSTTAVTQTTGTNLHTVVDSGTVTMNAGTGTMSVSQLAAGSVSGTLQTAQAANANGSTLSVLGMSANVFTVNMTGFTGTVNFEGSEDGANYSALSVTQLGTTTIATTAAGSTTTSIAVYECSVAGLQLIRARTSSVSAGNVTVTAHAVPVNFAVRTVNVANSNANGQNTMANSSPVVLASDQTAIPTKSGFTEVAGQGIGVVNGANTDLIPSTEVSAYKWFSLQVAGIWAGTLTFQCSNDNSNFVNAEMYNVASNNAIATTTTGNGVFHGPVAFRYFRVRMTAFTSNTSLAGTLELYTTISAGALSQFALNASTNVVGFVNLAPAISGGALDFHLVSAATNNATSIKAGAGQVYGYDIYNTNAAARFVKIYNKATAPAPATDTPFRTIGIAPNSRANATIPNGLAMGTGIALAAVTGIADTDNTSVGASDLVIDLDYK